MLPNSIVVSVVKDVRWIAASIVRMSSVNRAYAARQKNEIEANKPNPTETEYRVQLSKDLSVCCRSAKSKCCNISDSMKSLESTLPKHRSNSRKKIKLTPSIRLHLRRRKQKLPMMKLCAIPIYSVCSNRIVK